MTDWSMVLCLGALFTAVLLSLAMPGRFRGRTMGYAALGAGIIGIILYGLGYASLDLPFGVALLRAVLAVCRMFAGINDFSAIQGAECFQYSWVVVLFWAAHFIGFYITASAAVAALGNKLLQRLRLMLSWRGKLVLIYGTGEHAVTYGKARAEGGDCTVVFTGHTPDAGTLERIQQFGGVLYPAGEKHFLRKIGMRPGNRKMEVAALSEDRDANERFARTLLDSLKEHGIQPAQTSLLLSGVGEERGMSLQDAPEQYGYGSVLAFDQYDLAARMLMLQYPPCRLIKFDESGRAVEDFRVLLIGFGRTGRAALRQLIMNGQFPGSHFRADVFDRRGADSMGAIFSPFSPAREAYDIRFHREEAESEELWRFLKEEGDAIRLVVLCAGEEKVHQELDDDLRQWYETRSHTPRIVHCTTEGVFDGAEVEQRSPLFAKAVPDLARLDRMAMEINHVYQGEGETAEAQWARCDYFSRMSCRAAADFFPAVMHISGHTEAMILSGDWPPPEKLLNTLGEMEHERWCAFHYMMGYSPMNLDTFRVRAEAYHAGELREKPGKDPRHKQHVCLVPWEKLPELSRLEEEWAVRQVDYQQMDIDNILILPRVLEAAVYGEKGDKES